MNWHHVKRPSAGVAPTRVEVPSYDVVALVLQGGGALGAYQAGVCEGVHEAGIRLPDKGIVTHDLHRGD